MIRCLHGAVGHHHDWDLFKAFPQLTSHSIEALDLWSLFDASSPSLAEAGEQIATQAAPGDILLGYSLGGRLALHALLAEPGKWRAAIIISAHPGLPHPSDRSDRRTHDEKWAQLAAQDWPTFLTQWNTQPILGQIPRQPGLHQAEAPHQNAVAQSFRTWSLGTQADLRPDFPKITCPVLWLTGEKDPKFTELAQKAAPILPHGQHQAIPKAGHRLPWDQPEAFAEIVHAFISKQ